MTHRRKNVHLCFVGNMLGGNPGMPPSQGQVLADLCAKNGFKVSCVSSKVNRVARLVDIVRTLISRSRKIDCAVIDTFSGMSFVTADTASLACKLLGIPMVMVLHGGNLPEFAARNPWWTKRVFSRAEVLVAPSRFLAEKIGEHGFEIRVVPNVIDIDHYPYRERKGVSPRLIWMRSFHDLYNPVMAVRVLAGLKKYETAATLTMAGMDKGLLQRVKDLAGELGVASSVRFVGFLDQDAKVREFANADIYINTNRVDNMPVTILEARAFGLPVVATDVGGIPYLVKHGEDGLAGPDDDVDAMVKNIRSLVADPFLARQISRNGRVLAERSAWMAVRPEFEALISGLVLQRGGSLKQRFAGTDAG